MSKNNKFSFDIPFQIEKSASGEYRIRGQASTGAVDRQGERIIQSGLDITPLKEGKGILNVDHSNLPEDIIGKIDKAYFNDKGLFIEGYLFAKHKRANAIASIMDSLKPEDKQTFGLSVEGKIEERGGKSNKIIKRAIIDRVAWTSRPVNEDSYCELAKSLTVHETFKNALCEALLIKAMNVGYGQENAPATRSDGNALVPESLGGVGGKKKKKTGEIPGVVNVTFNAVKNLFSEHTRKSFSDETEMVDYILETNTEDVKLND